MSRSKPRRHRRQRPPAPSKPPAPAPCTRVKLATIGGIDVWRCGTELPFFYQAGIAIDADGALNAYGPHNSGLDATANAGDSHKWWGLVTDHGEPVVQGAGDPCPGFYVSTTALEDPTHTRRDPRRYVDSVTIPYFVLPGALRTAAGCRLGDFGVVARLGAAGGDRVSAAIFADIGPAKQLGEGSIALANALGIDASPRHGGTEHGVTYLVFPNSGNGRPRTLAEIQTQTAACFTAWGGLARLRAIVLPRLLVGSG